MQNPTTFAQGAQLKVGNITKQSPETLYAEYERLMNIATRSYVRSDGRGRGRQGQKLQAAWNKHAEWKKAVEEAAKPKPFTTGWMLMATTCIKCSFPIAKNQTRSILGEDFYHLECDPSAWRDY